MPALRVIILWHQHQPYYKDLVSSEYRLPWVRLHALKDYYGMVKLLDEFPNVHQTFNLVPSLMAQMQDYVDGSAHDPFYDVAAKPARDLTHEERCFALQYLFQANPVHMIGRYPRYNELWERFRAAGDSGEKAEKYFQPQDFTDVQVLSQLAWFDEFFLEEPDIAELVRKEKNYSLDDQRLVIARERELIGKVLPAHADAARQGRIEISTSPFYHPILPLVCDTNMGGVSTPGLPLPQNRFRHPEDARDQIQRGLNLHEKVFGVRPVGMWPSEGSVSEEVFGIAAKLGINWMASDEGVLARTLGINPRENAERFYTIHRFENSQTRMHLVFRDHTISDLIGFVYSGMHPQDAAHHLINNIKQVAQPSLDKGRDTVVTIILDGENAWEYYPRSGREFLRRFYDALQRDKGIEAVTVSEAIARHKQFHPLNSLVPGSWIHANFNVWIGAPEDNKSWDYLYHARQLYQEAAASASEPQRALAYEELLIAEGSDWNWWYGPEHHSANDREFDELYRKHLSNVYQALGATPPDYLSQPISGTAVRAAFTPQTHYIHPRIEGDMVRYFEWMGAAVYTADRRAGAMHGKQFLVDCVHAGIDAENVYGRLDFADKPPEAAFDLIVTIESWVANEARRTLRVEVRVESGALKSWQVAAKDEEPLARFGCPGDSANVAFARNFEFKLPLAWLQVSVPEPGSQQSSGMLRIRFSLWQDGLPIDALPVEGWIELQVLRQEDLSAGM